LTATGYILIVWHILFLLLALGLIFRFLFLAVLFLFDFGEEPLTFDGHDYLLSMYLPMRRNGWRDLASPK
jgi:hypothetical protein